jgi:hypothetical protein
MGPLLGPAVLAAAAHARGISSIQRDLAIRFVVESCGSSYVSTPSTGLTGDHCKAPVIQELAEDTGRKWSRELVGGDVDDAHLDACAISDFQIARVLSCNLAQTAWGDFFRRHLFDVVEPPEVLAVSVMFGAQVLPCFVACSLARSYWPSTRIAWGGALLQLLGSQPPSPDMVRQLVDVWWPSRDTAAFLDVAFPGRAGVSASPSPVAPVLQAGELLLYRQAELTLPYQCSSGCAYGRCAYCTYPAVEGSYAPGNLAAHVQILGRLITEAGTRRISFKDSLFTAARMRALAAELTRQRVDIEWSATTKASRSLDRELLTVLACSGLRTLEIGFETGVPRLQRLVSKVESPATVLAIAEHCRAAGVRLVVNRITGLPGETEIERKSDDELFAALTQLGVVPEVNDFELQRGSPMAEAPAAHGLRILRAWPWSARLDYEPTQLRVC